MIYPPVNQIRVARKIKDAPTPEEQAAIVKKSMRASTSDNEQTLNQSSLPEPAIRPEVELLKIFHDDSQPIDARLNAWCFLEGTYGIKLPAPKAGA